MLQQVAVLLHATQAYVVSAPHDHILLSPYCFRGNMQPSLAASTLP